MLERLEINKMLPGAIYRIALENFVTYKQVELFPGPSLNVIIGPNGTGKSTFVCAIILGLCGKTSSIGRAKKISEYVRSGCQEATIELELIKVDESHITITRTFDLEGRSDWSIDGRAAREKHVQELIAQFNIQVDNLCQLLPQDRVQDFSKLDPPELLRSTLSAVGHNDSVSMLDKLIDANSQQKNVSGRLNTNAQQLEEQIRLNERLKTIIDAMQYRKEIEKELDICEKKKMWIEYQQLRDQVNECNRDKKDAAKLVEQHQRNMEPLTKVLDKAKANINKLEQGKLKASRGVRELREKVKESLETTNLQTYRLDELQRDLQAQRERHAGRERELMEAKAILEKLVTDRQRLQTVVGEAEKVKMDLVELQKPINNIVAASEKVKREKEQVQYDLETNITPQIRMHQNRKRNMEDISNKRLEALRNYNEDCYQAVMWYRQNKELFQHNVYEPMLLEINFQDTKFAAYLENTVSNRDLVAFTFESTQDMNLFLKKVRNERGLKLVNAVCSQPSNQQFPPPCSIEELSYLGFYTWMSETLTAPAAIVRYLCRQYKIHRIPIGNDHTYNNSGKVPANITSFFTANHKFTVRKSAYSGATSSSTVEIRPARILATAQNQNQLADLIQKLARFEESAEKHREKIRQFDEKITGLENRYRELLAQKKQISDNVEKIQTLGTKIKMQKQKVAGIKQESNLDIEAAEAECARKQKEAVLKQCQLHEDIRRGIQAMQRQLLDASVWQTKLELSRAAIVQQEAELRELKTELQNVQKMLANVEARLTRCKTEAVEKLREAKRASGNKLPQDPEFPHKEEFDRLPGDLTDLLTHCRELETRIACMDEGDERVVKEYEEREKTIKRLQAEVKNSGTQNQNLVGEIQRLKEEWLPPVEELIGKINRNFSQMFAKMGCAGEVTFERPEDQPDKYSICIAVKFRDSESVNRLTRYTQSGGERALSTALYLMALQRLSAAPFRLVDEINQGMDPMNERKMFELLVNVTTDGDSAQYFLLTPKLLANLEYNDKIMVHTIMNGKRIVNYKKWKCDRFLKNLRDLDQHRAGYL